MDEEAQHQHPTKKEPQSHLLPNIDHLKFHVSKSGDMNMSTYDESVLASIIRKCKAQAKSAQDLLYSWSFLRAEEMLSDTMHVHRAAANEGLLRDELIRNDMEALQGGGSGSGSVEKKTSPTNSSSNLQFGGYWQDLQMWQEYALETPTSWNLIHLAVALGGFGRARLRTLQQQQDDSNSNNDQQTGRASATTRAKTMERDFGFFDLVNASSSQLKREKTQLAEEKLTAKKDSHTQQELFTRERILRATEAKILSAKCLSTPMRENLSVFDDFCRPAVKADPQAAAEAAFVMMSRGFEANQAHQERAKHLAAGVSFDEKAKSTLPPSVIPKALEQIKWRGMYEEVVALIVFWPCSTCVSNLFDDGTCCPFAPRARVPFALTDCPLAELRKKYDILDPGLVTSFSKFVDPMTHFKASQQCANIKAAAGVENANFHYTKK